jgi:hypothetical protein
MTSLESESVKKIIFSDIVSKIESNVGLSRFSTIRAKFEGWLKVELCETLSRHYKNVLPEQGRIDITFNNWGIELKTVNTNYRYPNVKNLHRPITINVEGVISDIEKLKQSKFLHKAILLVVFPVSEENFDWKYHLDKIKKRLESLEEKPFNFKE